MSNNEILTKESYSLKIIENMGIFYNIIDPTSKTWLKSK